jgi:hypothetical protein
MAGLVPAIHVFVSKPLFKTWMPATSAGMTIPSNLISLIYHYPPGRLTLVRFSAARHGGSSGGPIGPDRRKTPYFSIGTP